MTTDRDYLRNQQYRDDRNLNARAALHARFSTAPVGLNRWVFGHLDVPPDARVLEVGCGPGHLWAANDGDVPEGWRIVLSDFSHGMVSAARDRLGARGQFAFELADAEALPHPAASFDAVIANHMLYHVPDRARAIGDLARVLRPAGALYAVTNGSGHMRELDDLAAACGARIRPADLRFSLENGARQLSAAFADVELRPYDNQLRVTDADAVVAYATSMPGSAALDMAAMRRGAAAVIEREGVFRVTTAVGLFVARQTP
jgi:ubiquinone/menaquinone biosynthesis C-methylase UbiE